MLIHNPDLLPIEAIKIVETYQQYCKNELSIQVFTKDPFDEWPANNYRRGIVGSCCHSNNTIYIFLGRLVRYSERGIPLFMSAWVELLDTLIHEIRHFMQNDLKTLKSGTRVERENDARKYAHNELIKLALRDKDLFLPENMGSMGYIGVQGIKQVKTYHEAVYSSSGNSWAASLFLRMVRLKGIHIPKKISVVRNNSDCSWKKVPNPFLSKTASLGVEPIVWRDKLQRSQYFLRLGDYYLSKHEAI